MTASANSIKSMTRVEEFLGQSAEKHWREELKTCKQLNIEKTRRQNSFKTDLLKNMIILKITLFLIRVGLWSLNSLNWMRIWEIPPCLKKEMYFFRHHLCINKQCRRQCFKINSSNRWILRIFDITLTHLRPSESKHKDKLWF